MSLTYGFRSNGLINKHFLKVSEIWHTTRTLGTYGPLVLVTAEGVGALLSCCQVFVIYFILSYNYPFFVFFVFLSFCLFAFLPFYLFTFLPFYLFTFLPFCLFVTHHHTTFSLPNRNTGKCLGMSVISTPTTHRIFCI